MITGIEGSRHCITIRSTVVVCLSEPVAPVIATVYLVPEEPVVITLRGALWADAPAESLDATEKVYVVEGDSPATTNPVVVVLPIEAPFSKTV